MLVMEHADYNSEEPAHLWHQSILRVRGNVSDAFERRIVLNETRCRGFRSNESPWSPERRSMMRHAPSTTPQCRIPPRSDSSPKQHAAPDVTTRIEHAIAMIVDVVGPIDSDGAASRRAGVVPLRRSQTTRRIATSANGRSNGISLSGRRHEVLRTVLTRAF